MCVPWYFWDSCGVSDKRKQGGTFRDSSQIPEDAQDCAAKALEAVSAVGVATGECCKERDRTS